MEQITSYWNQNQSTSKFKKGTAEIPSLGSQEPEHQILNPYVVFKCGFPKEKAVKLLSFCCANFTHVEWPSNAIHCLLPSLQGLVA